MLPEMLDNVDPDEYLTGERAAQTRSEYLAGGVFAMAGASRAHNLITGDLFARFRTLLEGTGCDVYMSDLRVRVEPCDAYFYPDITVVCGDARFEDEHVDTLTNPTLVVEVLSDTTEAFDRGEKAHCYRRLSSLRTLVLVAQDRPRIEIHDRAEDGAWALRDASGYDAVVDLPSLGGMALPLSRVYERVRRIWPDDRR